MELEGGLIFVQGHNRKGEEYGSFVKQVCSGGEEAYRIKTFYPHKYCSTVEVIPNEAITEQRVAKAIAHHAKHSRAILPGVKTLDPTKKWRKTKENCLDLASIVLPLDIEKKWCDAPSNQGISLGQTNLHDIVSRELSGLFPSHSNLGYVARWSSTARVKREEDELRIRIYVFLDTPIKEEERIERFAGLDTDDSVFERNCLDLIQPALIMDRGVELLDIPHEEIIWKEGDRLPVADYPRIHKRKDKSAGKGNGLGEGKIRGKGSYHWLIDKWQKDKKVRLKPNSVELYRAIAEMAEEGLLEGRRFSVHFWLMNECFRRDGDCYKAMAFIASNPKVLGKNRTWQGLINTEQSLRHYFRNKWCGTPIKKLFDESETLTLDSLDTEDNKTLIEKYFEGKIDPFDESKAGSVVVDSQPIGAGKTSGTIKHFTQIFEDDWLSVCYRKSILLMQCKELGASYYLEIPEWYRELHPEEDFSKWSDFRIKAEFVRGLSNPAITIQSLQYLADQYGRLEDTKGLLVIDEPERVLQELWIKPEIAHHEKTLLGINMRFSLLMELASKAHTVVLADADASAEKTGWLVEYLCKEGKSKWLIENKQDWYRKKQHCKFESRREWLVALKKMHDAGDSILIHTDLGDDVEEFSSLKATVTDFLGLKEGELVGYHRESDFSQGDIRKDMNGVVADIRRKGARHLMLSPIIQIGANHTGDPFDRIMLYFHHGKVFGTDGFQTGYRDRKAGWIGSYFRRALRPTPHDAVSEGYQDEGAYAPTFSSGDMKELQQRLSQTNRNASENPAAAYSVLLEERNVQMVAFHYPISEVEEKQAEKAFKEHSKEGREEALRKLKEKQGLLKEFAALVCEKGKSQVSETLWANLQLLEDLSDVEDSELLAARRYLKKGKADTAKAMFDLWMMDAEERKQSAKGERLMFMVLQGELLDRMRKVMEPYFSNALELFRYTQQDGRELELLIEGTEEANSFNKWVRDNSRRLDVAALLEIRGWQESPHKIMQASWDALGFDAEVLDKLGGITEDGKKIATVVADDLYKAYRKERKVASHKTKTARRRACLSLVYEKKARGEELSELEENFFAAQGRRLRVKRRELASISVWRHIAERTGNPHYEQWREQELPACEGAL